jgi:hypothetical protein
MGCIYATLSMCLSHFFVRRESSFRRNSLMSHWELFLPFNNVLIVSYIGTQSLTFKVRF